MRCARCAPSGAGAGRVDAAGVGTTILVVALLPGGPPRSLLDMAVDSNVEFFSSLVLIEELAHTLSYAKFAVRIKGFGTNVDERVARYAALVPWSRPAPCRAWWRTIRVTIT